MAAIGSLFTPRIPAQPKPMAIPDAPSIDLSEAARQRRAVERQRQGRSSLVRDPALSTVDADGISIPTAP